MPAPVVVLTPNLCGRDGISRLARLVTASFDEVTVLALHEPASVTSFGRAGVRGAGGRVSRFVAAAVRSALAADHRTRVIVTHLHLAPAALAFAARGASLTTMLCGVEAWKLVSRPQRARARPRLRCGQANLGARIEQAAKSNAASAWRPWSL